LPTVKLSIRLPLHLQELALADLADLDFDAFEEGEDGFVAYAPAARWNDVKREHVERMLASLGAPVSLEEEIIPDENWNARWEASIQPLEVGPFLVKPSWHHVDPLDDARIILEIDPKMSFGTGYHPSTRFALRFLPGIVRGGELVLDAGCGTGILALAALKLGARDAIGFDIDPWASVNAEENAARNGLASRFEVREGSLEVVPESGFDIVLANINRNVLLDLLPALTGRLRASGVLVLAGLLREDRAVMIAALERVGRHIDVEATEDEWWAAVAT
jgi:ribosomal protein L11 methyltransferase